MNKISKYYKKLKRTKYFETKKRFTMFFVLIICGLLLAGTLIQKAYASYQSTAQINANIKKAIYVFETGEMSFNLDAEKIVPSATPYVYKFSVSNYTATKHSDIDIEYEIKIITTTNMPLGYKLYKNENYDDPTPTNLLTVSENKTDEDGAWYNVFSPNEKNNFFYDENNTDVYSLVITFPKNYYDKLEYADAIDSIEITLSSKQVID